MHIPETLLARAARRRLTTSSHPQRRGRPVVAPNSLPRAARCRPASSCSSVGNGPAPTRVAYALATPSTYPISRGPSPLPAAAAPAVVLDEVTNGKVP